MVEAARRAWRCLCVAAFVANACLPLTNVCASRDQLHVADTVSVYLRFSTRVVPAVRALQYVRDSSLWCTVDPCAGV